MTVGELQKLLSKHPADTPVLVYWEGGKPLQFFEVLDASMATGEPFHDAGEHLLFKFVKTGPAKWLFISISPD
jgi:hypothetical protein